MIKVIPTSIRTSDLVTGRLGRRSSINGATKTGMTSATGFTSEVRPQRTPAPAAAGADDNPRRNESNPNVEKIVSTTNNR
jgi:hypothetical protein